MIVPPVMFDGRFAPKLKTASPAKVLNQMSSASMDERLKSNGPNQEMAVEVLSDDRMPAAACPGFSDMG